MFNAHEKCQFKKDKIEEYRIRKYRVLCLSSSHITCRISDIPELCTTQLILLGIYLSLTYLCSRHFEIAQLRTGVRETSLRAIPSKQLNMADSDPPDQTGSIFTISLSFNIVPSSLAASIIRLT